MTEKKPSISEILKANRTFIIGLLSFPIVGMLIATGLVLYKKPGNMVVVLGVILFLLVQYALTVYYMIKRFDSLSVKSEEDNSGVGDG